MTKLLHIIIKSILKSGVKTGIKLMAEAIKQGCNFDRINEFVVLYKLINMKE